VRYLNVLLGAVLVGVPFMWDAGPVATVVTVGLGVALAALSIRRGPIRERYGRWDRLVV
jgi:hypothetical protein